MRSTPLGHVFHTPFLLYNDFPFLFICYLLHLPFPLLPRAFPLFPSLALKSLSSPFLMGSVFFPSLRRWMDELRGVDRFNIGGFGLAPLFFLKNVQLQPSILRAVVSFWDPVVHVFRFKGEELCPTVEEFQALLGYRPRDQVISPTSLVSFPKILVKLLGLNLNEARSLMRGGELHILQLIERFSPEGDPYDRVHQGRRRIAFCLGVLACFLLAPNNGKASPALADVMAQMIEGKDLIPMVLAETLLGLDAVHAGVTNNFAGSPLLLQVLS